MRFGTAIKELARKVSKSTDDSAVLEVLKSKLNVAYKDIGKAFHWVDIERQGQIQILANYTTGTVSVTKDSRTVSGDGTAWTSAMRGRYFKQAGGSDWYRIVSVTSNTELILETPINEDSASGITYEIWKKYYRLNTDVRAILPDYLDPELKTPFELHGTDEFASAYSGVFSVTKDSDILTGTATSFIGNVSNGDEISIGSQVYHVKTVDSNTQITMLNKAFEQNSDNGTIKPINPLTAVLKNTPTANGVKNYGYLKRCFDMVNDDDRTELSDDFDQTILDLAFAEYGKDTSRPNWTTDLQVANSRLEGLRRRGDLVVAPYKQFKVMIKAGFGRGN